jgi:hypothetical protein
MLEGAPAPAPGTSGGDRFLGLLSAALVNDIGGKGTCLLGVRFRILTAVTVKNPAL